MPSAFSTLTTILKESAVPAELLEGLITQLIRADATRSAKLLLGLARIQHHDKPASDPETNADGPKPEGPFTVDHHRPFALLIYVPRNIKSRLIDDGTGGYGYSHLTIDVGEVDEPTGKPVMTESTTQDVVHRSFQDHYGSRPYVRIDLSGLKLEGHKFRKCVNDKLGERYDDKEALTWGAVDDPAKEICSDMAADCLPDELRDDIARARLKHELRRLSVSVHRRFRPKPHVFISPNGFAQYFGAPPGSQVKNPDMLVTPANAPGKARKRGRKDEVAAAPAQEGKPRRKGGKVAGIVVTVACAVLIARWLAEQAGASRPAGAEEV